MKEGNVIPLYQQIRVQVLNDIRTGCLKVGDSIDTETVLMEKFHASRTTVRNAILALVQQGIITRTAGKGSFVKKNMPQAKVKLKGTFDDILSVAKNSHVKILRFEFIAPPLDILQKLELQKEERVLRIDRVRYVENMPFLHSINYLPHYIGKLLSIKDLEEGILTNLLTGKCQQVLKKQTQEFGANVADDYLAKLLKIPVGFPLLKIERITQSIEDRPLNFFISNFRSDLYTFTATFTY